MHSTKKNSKVADFITRKQYKILSLFVNNK